MMQHKTILFLIPLSKAKILEIEDKGVNYRLFLEQVQALSHVEVYETISEELISTANLYKVVVIVGHQVDGCIEMADGSLFPMTKISQALPSTYDGYLHVAVCGSTVVFDAIKQRCPNSRVRTSNNSTQLELHFFIYSLLLRHTDLSKETFDQWYEYYRNYRKELQESKNPEDLAKLPCATKLGNMSTYAAPKTVARNSTFPVKVFIHTDGEEADIVAELNDYRCHIKRNLKLNDGDQITWDLSFNTNPMPDYAKHIKGAGQYLHTWNSEETDFSYTFNCFLEPEFEINSFNGELKTTIGDSKPETWAFTINVTPRLISAVEIPSKTIENKYGGKSIEDLKYDVKTIINDLDQSIDKLSDNIVDIITDNKGIEEEKKHDKRDKYFLEIIKKIKIDYDKILNALEGLKKDYSQDELFIIEEQYDLCDKRREMLECLMNIRKKTYSPIKTKALLEDINRFAEKFFNLIFEKKTDIGVYNDLVKEFYTNDDGSEVTRYTGTRLNQPFIGLAIALANADDIKNKIYGYTYSAQSTEKLPIANQRHISNRVYPKIINLQNGSNIQKRLESYLGRDIGHSSVFAYFLNEVCKHRK